MNKVTILFIYLLITGALMGKVTNKIEENCGYKYKVTFTNIAESLTWPILLGMSFTYNDMYKLKDDKACND